MPPAPVNALFSGAARGWNRESSAPGIDMPVGSSLLCLAQETARLV